MAKEPNLTPTAEQRAKLTPEQQKELEEKLVAHMLWSLKNERILFFAESLWQPWKDIYAGDKENPDINEILSHPGKWLLQNRFHKELPKAFAHQFQRKICYPMEYPDLLERWKKSDYFVSFWGNRGGKSVAGQATVAMLCEGCHPLQKLGYRRMPPLHGWVVSPNLPSESDVPRGEDAPILKKFYEWLPDMEAGANWGIQKFYRKDKVMTVRSRRLKNKDGSIRESATSVINFKSFDQDINKLKGDDIDFLLWDEDPKSRVKWNEGTMRLMDRKGICFLAMTPDYDSVFTYALRREESNNPKYFFVDGAGAEDNPFLDQEEVKTRLAGLTPEERMMKAKGIHIQFRGRVFKEFDRNVNVGKPFTPSKETTQWVIIDWHPVKPVVITYLSINFKGIWYVFRESSISDHRVETVAKEYFHKITTSSMRLKVKCNVIDPIAKIEQIQEGRGKPRDIIDMLKDFGIYINPDPAGPGMGKENFAPAHAEIERKFKYRELYFDPECALHIDQFDTWGAKRYQKGNLEGTIRDQLEGEGNDTCVNLIYAHNSGAKFDNSDFFEDKYEYEVRPSTSRIYGKKAPHEDSLIRQILLKEAAREGVDISWDQR